MVAFNQELIKLICQLCNNNKIIKCEYFILILLKIFKLLGSAYSNVPISFFPKIQSVLVKDFEYP